MLKLAPVFLILSVVFAVYSLLAAAVLPKAILFCCVMLLFLSLLGKKNPANENYKSLSNRNHKHAA
jgi:hypothetical protein